MAWKIDSWSRETGSGSIRSPHFGPIPFEAAANVDAVMDYAVGESVLVELDGPQESLVVRSVRPMKQRQPPGTHWAQFDAVNFRFGDARVENLGSDSLQLWVGDCCESCSPDAIRLRFEGVSTVHGLDQDCDFDNPLFRLASPEELLEAGIEVPPGHRAFCIVTSHGNGPDGPRAFVVAQRARMTGDGPVRRES